MGPIEAKEVQHLRLREAEDDECHRQRDLHPTRQAGERRRYLIHVPRAPIPCPI